MIKVKKSKEILPNLGPLGKNPTGTVNLFYFFDTEGSKQSPTTTPPPFAPAHSFLLPQPKELSIHTCFMRALLRFRQKGFLVAIRLVGL